MVAILSEGSSLPVYLYASNNPLGFADETGAIAIPIGADGAHVAELIQQQDSSLWHKWADNPSITYYVEGYTPFGTQAGNTQYLGSDPGFYGQLGGQTIYVPGDKYESVRFSLENIEKSGHSVKFVARHEDVHADHDLGLRPPCDKNGKQTNSEYQEAQAEIEAQKATGESFNTNDINSFRGTLGMNAAEFDAWLKNKYGWTDSPEWGAGTSAEHRNPWTP